MLSIYHVIRNLTYLYLQERGGGVLPEYSVFLQDRYTQDHVPSLNGGGPITEVRGNLLCDMVISFSNYGVAFEYWLYMANQYIIAAN